MESKEKETPYFILAVKFREDGKKEINLNIPESADKYLSDIIYILEFTKNQFLVPQVLKNIQKLQPKIELMSEEEIRKKFPHLRKMM